MKFATGQYSKALCDRCGQQYDYNQLRKEWTGLKTCIECFEEKHPQLEPRSPSYEPQALYDPRPDRKESLDILVGSKIFPLITNISLQAVSSVGKVEVTT